VRIQVNISFQICGLGVHVKIVFVYDIHVLCIYIYNLSPFHGFLPSGLWEPFAADVRNLCGQGRCCHAALKICSKQLPKYGLKGPHSKMLKYDSIRILCFCWVSFGKESPPRMSKSFKVTLSDSWTVGRNCTDWGSLKVHVFRFCYALMQPGWKLCWEMGWYFWHLTSKFLCPTDVSYANLIVSVVSWV